VNRAHFKVLFRNRLLIVYRRGDRLSETSMRYLKWFYNIIYRIPTDVTDPSNFIESSENFPLITNVCNYTMIFLLSPISGEDEDPRLWDRLLKVHNKIPIITFYRAAYAFNQNSASKLFFNVNPICEEEGYIKNVSFSDETLGQGVEYPSVEDPASGYNSADDKDYFIAIEPLKKDEDFKPLILHNNKVVASQSGLNIFIGQKGLGIPHEKRAFNLEFPMYYLQFLNNLLDKSPVGYARLKLPTWPVTLRMDDLPLTTMHLVYKRKIMNSNELLQLLDVFRSHKAKITCMVTPAFIDKHGRIIPWEQGKLEEARKLLSILKRGLKEGLVEIGCHGLTHFLIGYKPSALIRFFALLKRANLSGEFYDELRNRELPVDAQKGAIEKSMQLIQKYFDTKPKVFTPPAHRWSSSTEKLLSNYFPYISAMVCFYPYGERNPITLGEPAFTSPDLLSVSVLPLGRCNSHFSKELFLKSINVMSNLGIPLIWSVHNYYPNCIKPDDANEIFNKIDKVTERCYMGLTQLGNLLKSYTQAICNVLISDDKVVCKMRNELEVILDLHVKGKIKEVSWNEHVSTEWRQNKINVPLGKHKLTASLKQSRKG